MTSISTGHQAGTIAAPSASAGGESYKDNHAAAARSPLIRGLRVQRSQARRVSLFPT
jgi:hypothetical protein